MMNMCAVAGLASSGIRFAVASIFLSASTRPYGLPAMPRRRASAANSRDREIAAWISIAASGARIIVASSAIGFEPSSSSRRPPPKNAANWAIRASIMIAARHRRGHRADEDVAVLDVRQLVRDHAFEFSPR